MPSNILSGTRYSDEQKSQWVKWYTEDEWTVAEICRKSGATRHTIMRAFRQRKVKLRGNPRQYNRKAILREIEGGKLTQTQIAQKFQCSQRLVSDLARGKIFP